MTEVTKIAMFKTAVTVGIIAILTVIGSIWPAVVGYMMLLGIIGLFIGLIYMFFHMYEDTKTWNKK